MPALGNRAVAGTLLLAVLCLAQQEPTSQPFRIRADLVTVPFQVHRGSRLVADLKPSDVFLLEDGAQRDFTVFEAPPVHPSLELVVMFDVTNPIVGQWRTPGFWKPKALREMANYWSEAVSRRLLDGRGDTIRFSIYRLDQDKLHRLCPATSDPAILRDALHRLAGPPANDDVNIPLPRNLAIRPAERQRLTKGMPPQPWSLAGAIATLSDSTTRDSATGSTARALVIFSTGAEGSTITPQDLADQAAAAGVPVYPVALFDFPIGPVAYEGYRYDSLITEGAEPQGKSMWGPAPPYSPIWLAGGPVTPPPGTPPPPPYLNYPFEMVGDLTGGLNFEAVNHSPPRGESGERNLSDGKSIVAFSMTGRETADVLERVEKHALARFHSSYTVGFVPQKTDTPHHHVLEVKLAPKTGGKVTEGKRTAAY